MDKYKNANRQHITHGKSAKQKRQTFRRCNETETAAMRENGFMAETFQNHGTKPSDGVSHSAAI